MPYIKEEDKSKVQLFGPMNCGQLNFALTTTCLTYLFDKDTSYQTYNDIIGALEACKLEFYRRSVAKYETQKAIENGDVYV